MAINGIERCYEEMFKEGFYPAVVIWTKAPEGNPSDVEIVLTTEIKSAEAYELLSDAMEKLGPSVAN